MKQLWLSVRAIAVPLAIIFGLKPLLDGALDARDCILPGFGLLAGFAHWQLTRLQRLGRLEQAADGEQGSE